jgi:DNA-binding PadR family transcriptional regulator
MSQESERPKGNGAPRSRHGEPEPDSNKMQGTGATEIVRVDIPTLDSQGNKIVLQGVPVEKDLATGHLSIDPAVVALAEAAYIAKKAGVGPRDLPILLTLYAKAGYFVRGVIPELSKFHKLLFYQSKRLESLGLGDVYVPHQFRNAHGGPVSESLKEDLRQLEKAGLVRVEWSEGVESPTKVELTTEGTATADKLWWATPESVREVSIDVKEDLYPMSGAAIREKVHTEYPLNRRIYVKRQKPKARAA